MYYKIIFRFAFLSLLTILTANVALTQTDARMPMNFSLQVSGQIRFANSHQPADHVLVRIESFSGGLVNQITTDRTGRFTFSGLSGTQYIVTAHAPGYIDVREDVNLVTANSGYLNIELVADRNAIGNIDRANSPNTTNGLSIINANVPVEAQSEYSKGKSLAAESKDDKLKEAVPHLEKAVAIFPGYLEAQILLGLSYMDLKDWAKAEKALQAAIKIDSRASTAYFALGEAFLRQKKYAEAQETLGQGIKVNESSAEGHLTLAKVLWEKAPTAKDEQQFRTDAESSWKEVSRALQLDPKLAEAHLLAGNMLLRAHRPENALVHFEEYLKLKPDGQFAAQTSTLIQKIKDSLSKQSKNN